MCGQLFYFLKKNNLLSENPLKYVMAEERTEATKNKNSRELFSNFNVICLEHVYHDFNHLFKLLT